MNANILLAISLILLSLEHFGLPVPPIVTGFFLLVTAILMLF